MDEPINPAEASELLRRITAVADKSALPFGDPQEPTYDCPDCTDTGWIMYPCRKSSCTECAVHDNHLVARPCFTCDRGIAKEAGYWYRFLYHRDRKGNPVIVAAKLRPFEQAMVRLGATAKRVQLALDAIVEREKAQKIQSP